MSETIVNGIFTLAGALVGSGGLLILICFQNKKDTIRKELELQKDNLNLEIERKKETINFLKQDLVRLANQVKSYWKLEKFYSEEIAELLDKKARTKIIEFRKKVEKEDDYEKPYMTAIAADKIISKYD